MLFENVTGAKHSALSVDGEHAPADTPADYARYRRPSFCRATSASRRERAGRMARQRRHAVALQ